MNSVRNCALGLLLLVIGLAGANPATAADERMVGLRDGGVLWVEVEGHDEDGIDFVRVDNGGRVRLPWHLLDPRFEAELREEYGYTDSATEEVLVRAEKLRTVDGEEIIGLIIQRTETELYIKTAQRILALPKLRVAGPAVWVRAPALDIYTREELYQIEATERRDELAQAGAAGAEAHHALAQYCERIYDFESAVAHYELASEVDSTWRPKDLESATLRARRKAEAQGQVDALRNIRRERQRAEYDDAFALIAAFRVQYPNSPLQSELKALEDSVRREREQDLSDAIVRRWHAWAAKLTREAGRGDDFDAAVNWAETQMTNLILVGVQADVADIDPEIDLGRVRTLWDARPKTRTHYSSYGIGTWLLGDDKARAGMKTAEDEAEVNQRDVARKDLEDRIKRYLERQKTVARASGGRADKDPAVYWKLMSAVSRGHWLLAYHAEFSGDVNLLGVHFRACRECAGSGVREVTSMGPTVSGQNGPRTRILSCTTCQHVGIVRRVSYR